MSAYLSDSAAETIGAIASSPAWATPRAASPERTRSTVSRTGRTYWATIDWNISRSSRDGSTAANLVRAARTYGLVARGFRKDSLAGLAELPLPLIAFWNFNHFLVVEGFDKHKVYLNDPAAGPRTITYDELDQGFTGVVLTLQPGPEFQKGGHPPSFSRALAKRLHGSWAGLVYCILIGLLLVVPGLVVPIFSKIFVDDYLVAGMRGWRSFPCARNRWC